MTKTNNQGISRIARSRSDKIFDTVNIAIMFVLSFVFAWPLLFVLSASFSDPSAVWTGQVVLFPVGFNLEGYKELFKYELIWSGYANTILYTVFGTCINIVMTILAAYPLSRKDFAMRNFFMIMFMITMYISGGLIPIYRVVSDLNLINTFWAMVIPNAVSIFNIIITRTYYINNIPDELREAAELDGANNTQFLLKIVLPLSKSITAIMVLYYGVAHWNAFFNALIYLTDQEKFPLQMILRDILIQNENITDMSGNLDTAAMEFRLQLAETIKYSAIIVASVPALIIYPFVQRHFVRGVMIGSLKG